MRSFELWKMFATVDIFDATSDQNVPNALLVTVRAQSAISVAVNLTST